MVAFHPPSPRNLKTSSPLKKLSMATWTCSSKIYLLLSFGSFGAPLTRGLIMSIKLTTSAGPIAVNGGLISKNL
jgi:hypothetical protein